jgi:hypothetical protein
MEAQRYYVTVKSGEDWTQDGRELEEDATLALEEATQGVLIARTAVQKLEAKYNELKRIEQQGFMIEEDDDEQ